MESLRAQTDMGDAPALAHSVTGTRWQALPLSVADERIALAIQQRFGLSDAVARLLVAREQTLESTENFLRPTLRASLPDPAHLLDMDKAVSRLVEASKKREIIAVFGDYDVDGATSTALLTRYFTHLGLTVLPYIPDRIEEGYGPNSEAFAKLKEQGAALIITVDCGTVSYAPIETACALGMDVIVVDHHIGGETLPDAVAVINPNRLDEQSECGNLAAVGVSFLLCIALNRALREQGYFTQSADDAENERPTEPALLEWLDMVALGTVCDVMQLTGLNRAYVHQGLNRLMTRQNIGLAALMDVAGLKEPPTASTFGFVLGPRINAGGRVGEASLGARLLSTHDAVEAEAIAEKLNDYNRERQAIEQSVLEQAMAMAESQANQPVIMLHHEGWHPGVIGIVAGRIKETYDKPTAIIAVENGIGKASARSVAGVNLGALITQARQEELLIAGGGHAMAAGFTIDMQHYENFYAYICMHLADQVAAYHATRIATVDMQLSVSGCTLEMINELAQLAPYGMGNPSPRIMIPRARIVRRDVLKDVHIRLKIVDDTNAKRQGAALTAMAFRAVGTSIGDAMLDTRLPHIHLLGELNANHWQDSITPQFIIRDAARADT